MTAEYVVAGYHAALAATRSTPTASEIVAQLERLRVSSDRRKVIEWCIKLRLTLREEGAAHER